MVPVIPRYLFERVILVIVRHHKKTVWTISILSAVFFHLFDLVWSQVENHAHNFSRGLKPKISFKITTTAGIRSIGILEGILEEPKILSTEILIDSHPLSLRVIYCDRTGDGALRKITQTNS